MVVLGGGVKYHYACVVVFDIRCMLELLWDYLVPDISNLLSILLDSTCSFS